MWNDVIGIETTNDGIMKICDCVENRWNNLHIGVFVCDQTTKSFEKSRIVCPRVSCGARKRRRFSSTYYQVKLENWIKQIKISCGWCNNFLESIILDGSSERCYKISCWNSRLGTAKYGNTTLEKILEFSIERISTTLLYEYRRVNGIIYLTINSVSRRSNDMRIILQNGYTMIVYITLITQQRV